ncbi:hypothetical protein AKJ58_01395 [candidate division MSBL1 archaeon SCGC-AAA385D11]|uniref:SpoVT-AbrB domain-containing protein n=1 Tax=candidate division MSBL1 archaeon SCGC-AAA385D11 TaxID=1698286 RepID=A0A133VNF0_9EURY|nr:hypothetical protein AKJ58_01395 [candidate division MSBL1 archaeon SCGC-AAA385D11]
MPQVPIIETRRIHPIGEGGLSILLPKKWADRKGLQAGNDVLVLADDSVTVEPVTSERIEEIERAIDRVIKRGDPNGGE